MRPTRPSATFAAPALMPSMTAAVPRPASSPCCAASASTTPARPPGQTLPARALVALSRPRRHLGGTHRPDRPTRSTHRPLRKPHGASICRLAAQTHRRCRDGTQRISNDRRDDDRIRSGGFRALHPSQAAHELPRPHARRILIGREIQTHRYHQMRQQPRALDPGGVLHSL